MTMPLHYQATATTLLFALLPMVSCLVPQLSIREIQSVRNTYIRKIARDATARKTATTATQLSLGIDPTDIVAQHAHLIDHHHTLATAAASSSANPTSTLDFLSSFTLAKASVVPNQSVAPLTETIKSTMDGNMIESIPDMPTMPGGAPRSGNPFLAESFRELYNGSLKSNPQTSWTVNADGGVVIPARELDVIGRYADLLSRIPLAAAVYALVDFFLINAEEDLAIAELLDDDEEVEAIMEVENRVVMQRFAGLFMVVFVTVAWSFLSYHPVPFSEL